MPELKEVIISLTNRCNLRCRMCEIPLQDKWELPAEIWRTVISDASLLQAKTVVFSGGEPLLREDLFGLISFAKKMRMQACVTSNGYLLDEKAASSLCDSGVDVVNISLDGPQEMHDYLRGKGSFKKALQALDNLKKYNIEATVASVVSGYNYKDLVYLAGVAGEHGATTIKFQPFSKIFLGRSARIKDFLFPAQAQNEFEAITREVIRTCASRGISTNPREYMETMPYYLSGKAKKAKGPCQALLYSCPINPSGEVYPCWVVSGKGDLIGSVKKESLRELWASEKRAAIISRINREGCPGCMMSCYDDIFGKDGLESRIAVNIGRFRQEGAQSYLMRLLKKLKKKAGFYFSYRGSPAMFKSRLKKLFKTRSFPESRVLRQEVSAALEEIKKAKGVIEEEIKDLE